MRVRLANVRRFVEAGQAQLKVRLPEALRYSLEREARSRGHSMNAEIVRRLRESVLAQGEPAKVVAKALLSSLDDAIVNEIVDTVLRERAQDDLADMAREEQQISEDLK